MEAWTATGQKEEARTVTIDRLLAVAASLLALSAPAPAGLIVDYGVDVGGSNGQALNGLAASAEFEIDGLELTITLSNTSTGVPSGAEVSDSLLVSLAFDLPDGIVIVSGDTAVIAAGSHGLGSWAGEGPGFDVGDEWAWTNDGAGDLLEVFSQVITTSQGMGGGARMGFNGDSHPNVKGPFGGMAASPPHVSVPRSKPAVSDSIEFTLTLSDTLSASQLLTMAGNSVVEFGSDYQYLGVVPTPGTLGLLAVALFVGRRSRRRRA
jgi:hypothetical protein